MFIVSYGGRFTITPIVRIMSANIVNSNTINVKKLIIIDVEFTLFSQVKGYFLDILGSVVNRNRRSVCFKGLANKIR